MKITRENIEAYLIDYLHNDLSSEDYLAVQKFLEDHPDLDPGNDSLAFIPNDEIFYDKKDLLKKNIRFDVEMENMTDGERKEYLLFLLSENLLRSDQEVEMEDLRFKDRKYDNEARIAQMIQFKPENEILFPDKNQLKRKSKKMRIIPWVSFAAASIFLALLIWNFQEQSIRIDDQFGQKKRGVSSLSEHRKNKKFPSSNAQSKIVLPINKSEEEFFNLTSEICSIEQTSKANDQPVLQFSDSTFNVGLQKNTDVSLLIESNDLMVELDSSEIKGSRIEPKEENDTEIVSFSYFVPPTEPTYGIKDFWFSKKKKGVKSFHLRLGSFYFSYSKTLIEK